MRLTVILAAVFAVLFASTAEARPRRHAEAVDLPFFGLFEAPQAVARQPAPRRRAAYRTHRRVPEGLAMVMAEGAGRIVSHPPGCPSRAFCGCGASVRVFGRSVRSLWRAAEWLRRFPRAQPAPGMVAARPGHVFVLERQISGSTWLVYDANSGHHRTRVHPRSIAGFVIVDPSAGA
jgi:hypothetical protein